MSTTETCFSSYGEDNDNDLVMEALGRNPLTNVFRVMGGKTIAYTVEAYRREFQEPAVPVLAEQPKPVDAILPAQTAA